MSILQEEGYLNAIVAASLTLDDGEIFDATWDAGIVMLGTHHALLSLNRLEEASGWLGRFLGYASSRLTANDIAADMPKGGVNVAWDRSEISSTPDDLEE